MGRKCKCKAKWKRLKSRASVSGKGCGQDEGVGSASPRKCSSEALVGESRANQELRTSAICLKAHTPGADPRSEGARNT